jgi:phosphate transport system permease protein
MSSELLTSPVDAPPVRRSARGKRMPRGKAQTSLLARGEPMLWLTGGALVLALAMIASLIALIVVQGAGTFWPRPLVQVRLADGALYLGEITDRETYVPSESALESLPAALAARARESLARYGNVRRRLFRTENFELTGEHFHWIDDYEVVEEGRPQWALLVERLEGGRFYGMLESFVADGKPLATAPQQAWAAYRQHHDNALRLNAQRHRLESDSLGAINARLEAARLAVRQAELDYGKPSPEYAAAQGQYEATQSAANQETAAVQVQIDNIARANQRYQLVLTTADGQRATLQLANIVRAIPANQLGWLGRLEVYLSRWWEFLTAEPRETNSEGGVFPAIFGTVVMTLLMSIAVVPFGVLAALYLREYAKKGFLVSVVRVAINNLAGVPSIVFGVFGLGFFCYFIGANIDQAFYEARLPNPTFGKGALIWASFTLALMTLPVVIVATEEALAAVPNSMREGSYACGASKWQTIWRIVLPRALPGIMTGMILAMARGAGEVAPLMLVGAVKLAPELPLDWLPPFGVNRSFMHLGFHIFDLGFQSQNSDAAKPMVFTTTLLLIAIIVTLNVSAVWLRGRLRKRYLSSKF